MFRNFSRIRINMVHEEKWKKTKATFGVSKTGKIVLSFM
jgi:hypothetical protein